MATLKQIEANRRNAQKSTGPRSEAGKAVSSRNALKSGIDAESECVYNESIEDLEKLKAEYLARFRPSDPEERFYVDVLIRNDWLRRRFARIDAEILEHQFDTAFTPSKSAPDGQAYSAAQSTLARLQRRIELTERFYKNALHELERLQQSRQVPEHEPAQGFQPLPNKPASPEIGFVPQALRNTSSEAHPQPGKRQPAIPSASANSDTRLRLALHSKKEQLCPSMTSPTQTCGRAQPS